jgi:hypothetical protein
MSSSPNVSGYSIQLPSDKGGFLVLSKKVYCGFYSFKLCPPIGKYTDGNAPIDGGGHVAT